MKNMRRFSISRYWAYIIFICLFCSRAISHVNLLIKSSFHSSSYAFLSTPCFAFNLSAVILAGWSFVLWCVTIFLFPSPPPVTLRTPAFLDQFPMTIWRISRYFWLLALFFFPSMFVVAMGTPNALGMFVVLSALFSMFSYTSVATTSLRQYVAQIVNKSLWKYHNNRASGILLNQNSFL